jgi:hypothetical protein
LTTTPFTGERMVVWSRLICACASAASFCLTRGLLHAQLGLRRADRFLERPLVRLRGVVLRERGVVPGLRGVAVGLGDEPAGEQLRGARERAPGVRDRHHRLRGLRPAFRPRGLRVGDGAPGLLHLRLLVAHGGLHGLQVGARLVGGGLEQRGVDARDHLALAHLRVEVGGELLDGSRDLAADQDHDHRIDVAGGRHDGAQLAALDGRGAVLRRRTGRQPQPGAGGGPDDEQRGQREAERTATPARRRRDGDEGAGMEQRACHVPRQRKHAVTGMRDGAPSPRRGRGAAVRPSLCR